MSGILSLHSPLLDKFRPLSSTDSTSDFTEVFRRVTGHGAGDLVKSEDSSGLLSHWGGADLQGELNRATRYQGS